MRVVYEDGPVMCSAWDGGRVGPVACGDTAGWLASRGGMTYVCVYV